MTLIEDARHELQGRYRGRDERLARLTAAGAPTGHDELREWLRHELDRETEREGGVFYPHTARISNGVDDDLPQRSGIGCRISRVRFRAELTDNGETWKVFGGSVGPGYSGHAYVASSLAATEAEAIDLVRRQLLADGCCLTREAAEASAKQLLDERVDSQRSRRGGAMYETPKVCVLYDRVSTERQARSGIGGRPLPGFTGFSRFCSMP